MSKANIYYHDIGDYLSREEKLAIVQKFGSVENMESQWQILQPNEHGDWLNLRDDAFGEFIPIGDKDDKTSQAFFNQVYSRGLASARDAWCYNSLKIELEKNIHNFINFYNEQREAYHFEKKLNPKIEVENFVTFDSTRITWNRGLKEYLEKNKPVVFENKCVTVSLYRPFFKQHVYFSRDLNDMVYQLPKLFPSPTTENRVICVSAAKDGIPVLITDCIPDLHFNGDTQAFPLYYYEERAKAAPSLFDAAGESEYIRRDGVSDFILTQARSRYGERVSKEDIFYYVYGFLHSPEYRSRFSADLKKMLPRLPLVESPKDFWAFSKAGRSLADLHLGYDDFANAPKAEEIGVVVRGAESGHFQVEKMRFPSKDDKSRILYNSQITVENIPAQAYEYQVNGKSAIEWVMERYAITTHKESGIRNDPNDWAAEVGNPRYILDLLLSVIRLSVETVEVVRGLPGVSF
ncbi:MAG: hypothetical protein JNN28_11560 [Saprospiraceae bacterium]|nr:hypothetical protein [Saprospiraceae bacterium]